MPRYRKIILLGSEGVGKTSLLERLCEDRFSETPDITVGAAFCIHNVITSSGESIKLNIWDTAGQEKFQSIIPIYAKGTDVALVCTDRCNIGEVRDLCNFIDRYAPDAKIYIVITKIDKNLVDDFRSIEDEDYEVFYTSAASGEGVQELFLSVAEHILTLPQLSQRSVVNLDDPDRRGPVGRKKTKCCHA